MGVFRGLLGVAVAVAMSGSAFAQSNTDERTFKIVVRNDSGTVLRGRVNTLTIPDLFHGQKAEFSERTLPILTIYVDIEVLHMISPFKYEWKNDCSPNISPARNATVVISGTINMLQCRVE